MKFKSIKSRNGRHSLRLQSTSAEANIIEIYNQHTNFLRGPAKVSPIPQRFLSLLKLLDLRSKNYTPTEEDFVSVVPSPIAARKGINPFLIPISESVDKKSLLCYIRWPTQKGIPIRNRFRIIPIYFLYAFIKENMDLQLVRASSDGMLKLVSLGTDQFCHRLVVEMVIDFTLSIVV